MNRPPLALLVLLPLLLLGCPGGKDKKDKTEDDTDKRVLNDVSVKLVVGGVDPSFGDPDVELRAEVFGSGFEKGASVIFGNTAGREVRVGDDTSLTVLVPALRPAAYDVTVINPDGVKATLRKGLTIRESEAATCRGVTIYFDFDSSGLAPAVRDQLESVAACVRASGQSVVVEGHCDERGTTEYNLSLGQRRADAVSRYLAGLGVNPGRLRPVSWGEEKPVSEGHDADAWAANRRAVLVVE